MSTTDPKDALKPAVRPRDASSLLLIRDGELGPEALMGRRAKRSRFMPDLYVFPGGALDAGDGRARPATALPAGSEAQMAVSQRPGRARALAMAAVRETFEETGVVVGRPGHPGDATPGWTAFAETGCAPDLADLHYIGRAITPTFIPIRFHARFFMAPASAASGEPTDTGELVDLRWVNLRPPGGPRHRGRHPLHPHARRGPASCAVPRASGQGLLHLPQPRPPDCL